MLNIENARLRNAMLNHERKVLDEIRHADGYGRFQSAIESIGRSSELR